MKAAIVFTSTILHIARSNISKALVDYFERSPENATYQCDDDAKAHIYEPTALTNMLDDDLKDESVTQELVDEFNELVALCAEKKASYIQFVF